MQKKIPKRELEWKYHYSDAQHYYLKNKNLNVPLRYVCPDGFRLGYWIGLQRKKYRKGTLDDNKIILLESIGMIWNIPEYEWKVAYSKAQEYYNEYGSLFLSNDYVCEDGFKLGRWLAWQRNRNTTNKISKSDKDALDDIGMVWNMVEERWNRQLQKAKNYYEKNNSLVIPEVPENQKIIGWIRHQRRMYKEGKLSDEKIKLLESIGMVWNIKPRKKK